MLHDREFANKSLEIQPAPKTSAEASIETKNQSVEVLYQKMGNRWFAFSVVEGEVFMGSISQQEVDALEANDSFETYAITGNT